MPVLNVPVENGRVFVNYICHRYRRADIENALTMLGIEVSGGFSRLPHKESLAAILARRMLDEEIDVETIIRTLESFKLGRRR